MSSESCVSATDVQKKALSRLICMLIIQMLTCCRQAAAEAGEHHAEDADHVAGVVGHDLRL
eukprot:CAMPEP_0173171468 /NCGR_PEP_ID=MMETSP1141-20130122/1784_1 /TAXON_ID=483371 /ORGANISM="non described non described, Strain CCMP2298" /LENGTH=60 /DNA_ID=CAMNT_0014093425 /DNA_START=316 /DNA_END=499 /DNA_ORIENTATION=+